MANKNLFKTKGASVPITDTVNKAGGKAYSLSDDHALAQMIVTSCFADTFYTSEAEQLNIILDLAKKCSPEFIAKAAVYGHEVGKMKDTPALMLAVLAERAKTEQVAAKLFKQIFPRIITRTKMLFNFVLMIRSNRVGRRSLGSMPRNEIRKWLASHSGDQLFLGSMSKDPSLADVIRLAHPLPDSPEKNALYGYLLNKPYEATNLPEKVRQYEFFKTFLLNKEGVSGGRSSSPDVPHVPFQMLASLPLTESHWKDIILNMPWNALRMNLNTGARHGVFKDKKVINQVAVKLADQGEIQRNNVFPYQLMTAYLNVDDEVPQKIKNALQDAMEFATANIPVFPDGVAVCIDTSGSMHSSVTGIRKGATSKATCVQIAALVGASIARKNPEAILVPFDTKVHSCHYINPKDSIMTNATNLSRLGGGGTDVAAAMRHLNTLKKVEKPKTVIFVSDNESWYNPSGGCYRGTRLATEWEEYKRSVKGAKLICIDISSNDTTQVTDGRNVLNIGGFSDGVWPLIQQFIENGDTDFVKLINKEVSLEDPAFNHDEEVE